MSVICWVGVGFAALALVVAGLTIAAAYACVDDWPLGPPDGAA